jgi:hypothetical protein
MLLADTGALRATSVRSATQAMLRDVKAVIAPFLLTRINRVPEEVRVSKC